MGIGKWAKNATKKIGDGAKTTAKKAGSGAKRAGTVALNGADKVLRAPGRALQDVPVAGRIADSIPSITDPLAPVFESVVATSLAKAKRVGVPSEYTELVRRYIDAHTADGQWLDRALSAKPRFHSGGWILSLQPKAAAMTMDNDVFIKGSNVSIRLYVHELVHVGQYRFYGRTNFLTSYFGLSATTIASRFLRRKPIDVMTSSPYEQSAYAIEKRFCTWLASQQTKYACS
jgi:hypothetical protein